MPEPHVTQEVTRARAVVYQGDKDHNMEVYG